MSPAGRRKKKKRKNYIKKRKKNSKERRVVISVVDKNWEINGRSSPSNNQAMLAKLARLAPPANYMETE